jgi:PST family polysaccharide transporter
MPMNDSEEKQSYGQILKSTTLVGGSQVVSVLLGIFRTKVMALLLGPNGIGLVGLFGAVTGMMATATSLGIGSSGVRQIAEAAGTGDEKKISRTILSLRRTAVMLGLLGTLVTIGLCRPLSQLTFGNADHATAIAFLSVTIFFGAVSNGQVALVQGMRRIADLARLSVLGALLGTLFSIPMVYFYGEAGIVPFIVAVSFMSILTSWWFARKVPLAKIEVSLRETGAEARGLVSLGLVFMASGLMSTGAIYLVRVLVLQQIGLEAVGLYQAAYTLSTLYIGFVLSAMGMDFYPRLTAVAQDNLACNRMVNEQTVVGLLVATPGILATLTFAPLIMQLFYSPRFILAYSVLRWQVLGVFLRVVSWPLGYVIVAKGKGKIFFWTELAANATHVGFIWFGLYFFGLEGTGIAFFVLYIFYTVMIFAVVRRISGFNWSAANLRHGLTISVCIGLAFLFPRLIPQNCALTLGAILTMAMAAYCLRALYLLMGPGWLTSFGGKVRAHLSWLKTKES